MGNTAAPAGAAVPFRDCGPDGAADGLSRSTPLHADNTTTRPSGSGQTRQSNARDSMSTTSGAELLLKKLEGACGMNT